MSDLAELSASEAARRIRAGSMSPVDLLAACLERVDKLEPAVQAWVTLDREAAMRAARGRAPRRRAPDASCGALHGVPVALKDIFDVAGLPTRAGVTFYDRRPDADATSVARLRAAGAVVMGKVVTTSFALMDPGPTRNPWNPEHTPGGSSSGSAAAVGARMAPLALGSQTVGSVLRPAAYCGVVGLQADARPDPDTGVVPLAWSLDHVGIFARAVEDAALALGLMAGPDGLDPLASAAPVDDYALDRGPLVAPRIGVLRALVERAAPETAAHVAGVAPRARPGRRDAGRRRAAALVRGPARPRSAGGRASRRVVPPRAVRSPPRRVSAALPRGRGAGPRHLRGRLPRGPGRAPALPRRHGARWPRGSTRC